jgi:hypothetical protein
MADIHEGNINEEIIPWHSMAFRAQDLFTLLSSSAIWYIVFIICKRWAPNPTGLKKYEGTEEYRIQKCRYMLSKPSFIHTCLMTILGSIYLYQYGFSNYGYPKHINNFEYYTIFVSLGYFLYDFINVSYLIKENRIHVLHHIFSMLGFGIPIVFNQWGCSAVIYVWICEVSGPFFQLRVLLNFWNVPKTFETINDLVFVGVFIFCRVFLCDYCSNYLLYDNLPWFYRLPIFIILFISFVWIWEMINKLLKLINERFPNNKFCYSLYMGLKKNRTFVCMIWFVFAFVFCTRLHLDYLNITKLGIKLIPKFPYYK